ncbi:MAG: spore coat protein U domain-containing protein [Geminicoccaceae bacterium]|nr:spore coat protein U domain-containing protein [Geminicoccaceae bacterium]
MTAKRIGLATAAATTGIMLLAGAAEVRADGDTATLNVQATVQESCGVNGSSLDFGTYISGQTDAAEADATLSFSSCPAGQLTFEFDGGQAGDTAARAMSNGSGELSYQLYRDAARAQVWGAGSDAARLVVLVPGSGTVPVYGRIPGGQAAAAGTYADTIAITMSF